MLSSRILRKIIQFRRAKKVWYKPKSAPILIFDRAGADFFLNYIDSKEAHIFEVRAESVNIWVLLRCFLAFDFHANGYIDRYILTVNPKIVLTSIDNYLRFYQLKSANPNIITIFVQNAWRGIMSDIFGNPAMSRARGPYRVDYMLTLGTAIGEKYLEYIDGQVIPIGSMRCNHWAIQKPADRRSVLFVSQYIASQAYAHHPAASFNPEYTSSGKDPEQRSVGLIEGRTVTWGAFYTAERRVLSFLSRYCASRNLTLQICGRSDTPEIEQEFFTHAIGNDNWEFTARGEPHVSYGLIDRASYVVSIDSTLAYESLARGKRTGVFSIRGELLDDPGTRFGWPAQLADTGPFWTNHPDETEFNRILNYLEAVGDDEWQEVRRDHMPNLIDYDPGNARFVSLVNGIRFPAEQNARRQG